MTNDSKHPDFPIDWNDLYGRIGDEGIIAEFTASFIRNSHKLMSSLAEAVASDDSEQIELYAHALKGSASNIGAISLAKAAWQLEKNASENHADKAADWLERIIPEYEALHTLLQKSDWVRQAKDAALIHSS